MLLSYSEPISMWLDNQQEKKCLVINLKCEMLALHTRMKQHINVSLVKRDK